MQYKDFVTNILKESSEIARKSFGKVTGTVKEEDSNQVLTETDLEIGKLLVDEISNLFPKHNIIDEESGVINKSSKFTWVVDPIDGTSNFAEGVPTFGIIIGLLNKDTPVLGGVALPSFNEIIVAERGKGAYCNGERLSVTKETKLLSTLVAYSIDRNHDKPEITRDECKLLAEIVLKIRNLRAAASVFDAVMVAKGKYGGYLNRTSKIWDNVGQQIIVEEAGGLYTDFFGKPVDYSNPLSKVKENYTWCMGAPEIHKKLQEIIHR